MKRIAVIEDNADNRLLVRAILGRIYEVMEYPDGPRALIAMTTEPPDLILLDISLPFMDGENVLQRIRRDERLGTVPVIAFTAHAMRGDRERLLAAGFDDYLMKPVNEPAVLRQAVAKWLNSPPSA